MLSGLLTIEVVKNIIIGLGSLVVTLVLHIYHKDIKAIKSKQKDLDDKLDKSNVDMDAKFNNTHKAIELRFEDFYSDLDRLMKLPEKVKANEKDIEWLKRSEHKSNY